MTRYPIGQGIWVERRGVEPPATEPPATDWAAVKEQLGELAERAHLSDPAEVARRLGDLRLRAHDPELHQLAEFAALPFDLDADDEGEPSEVELVELDGLDDLDEPPVGWPDSWPWVGDAERNMDVDAPSYGTPFDRSPQDATRRVEARRRDQKQSHAAKLAAFEAWRESARPPKEALMPIWDVVNGKDSEFEKEVGGLLRQTRPRASRSRSLHVDVRTRQVVTASGRVLEPGAFELIDAAFRRRDPKLPTTRQLVAAGAPARPATLPAVVEHVEASEAELLKLTRFAEQAEIAAAEAKAEAEYRRGLVASETERVEAKARRDAERTVVASAAAEATRMERVVSAMAHLADRLAGQPAPVVHVAAPVVNLPAPQVEVHVEAPPPSRPRAVRVEYDKDGNKRFVPEEI